MISRARRRSLLVAAALFWAASGRLPAATYLPLSDADLARKSPVIVRAQVLSQEIAGSAEALSTVTTLRALESLKGMDLALGDLFRMELPGGGDGSTAFWIPGTPRFSPGGEAVLFLARHASGAGDFAFTEFGLSKFDLVADRTGRTFAVRPVFSDEEDDAASNRRAVREIRTASAGGPLTRTLRDGGSFLAMLRSVSAGTAPGEVLYASPDGELAGSRDPAARRPLWVNIGGVEGTGAQFRWFWDTGFSPNAIVSATGTQTGLSDGSNGLAALSNGATQWSSVASTTVRYSMSSGSAPVVVHLDVTSQPPAWTDTLSCTSGGVIGYGGPGSSRLASAFKGEGSFYAPASGNVWMRKVTGGCYSAATFRSAVLHELGHTLGLGHSDDGPSTHSTTASSDWNSAVMHSVIPSSRPSVPQADDIQAIQYYYGSGSTTPPAPSASFSFSPASPVNGQPVSFVDDSGGSPTSWAWNFGDGALAATQNPTHTFATGIYTVTLTAGNAGGSTVAARTVTVSAGTPSPIVPRAAFSFSPESPAAGATVQFTDGSSDAPTSWAWNFGDPLSGNANFSVLRNPPHAFASPGAYTVSLTVSNAAGSTTSSQTVAVASCGGPGGLCLNGGRFRVQASWRVPSQGTSGAATPVALTGDTGYFWFFTSNNVELVVKVVDGTPFNGRFWFFSGALSDVEYTVQVTDTRTGAVRTYFNPQGTLASTADTSAFAGANSVSARSPFRDPDVSEQPVKDAIPASPAPDASANEPAADAPCAAAPTALCLNGGRFRVEVAWQVPSQGTAGAGIAVPLTGDTGHFWFFSANNVELVVKVVDGRAFNGHFWLFSGALSDVAYTITVTDTATGAVRSYANPSGRLASFSDVSAF